ncbi:MAG: uncharacterized protein QOI21_558 [Actinomycetota bacterium]|jgi:uncharacterized protein YcbX|nr:uncharacterized protein [Actinomycetota bacterium]
MARVSWLGYYPVKACGGTSVEVADVGPAGLRHDRAFMVVAPDGNFRSQRRFPIMAAIRPVVLDDGRRMALSAPGVEDVVLNLVPDGQRHEVATTIWQGKGVNQGPEAQDWFSTALGAPSMFVGVPPDHARVSTGVTPGTAGFADSTAMLVVSDSSLDTLNERIASRGGEPVPMERFRPNIVVSGWVEPHTEDRVRAMTSGSVDLGYAKPCIRCSVTLVDQETGVRSGPEPIRTLADYRREPDGVAFGMKAAVTKPGQLAVGDEVIVHSWLD